MVLSRRDALKCSAAALAGWIAPASGDDQGRPAVDNPRATSGDDVHEPNWEERLTLTVGPHDADIVGTSEKAIQAAVDSVTRWGGGTVRILPGKYLFRNAVYLASKVRVVGSGTDTEIVKAPSVKTKLSADSDWYDQEITLADAAGFRVGDGICLRAKNPHHTGSNVAKRTLVARSGNRFKLDRPLRENFWEMGDPTVATLFPLFSGEYINQVVIENLVLDGNKANSENLDGNYAGCVFLQDCNRISIRGVTARNFNGDGLSWQICHDVLVENCHSHDNAGLGLHPGSGSQRPTMRNNTLERNDIGIFFCWGVKFGLAEKNTLRDNLSYGVSIGHRDNNNLVRDNEIAGSGKVGVLFRPERGKPFAPHRNRFESNRITNSGPADGVAIDVQGETEAIVLERNVIRETRDPMQRVGIRIGKQTRDVKLIDNSIAGVATAVDDQRLA
ncbi:MAG: right-handed parallel beta-helix repeat-containing protein [Planctomycetaceae bacterium]|nr:MAG: right-handed parallel beta-helix repeat-containing protein [Planctomycetaceae bacterium]